MKIQITFDSVEEMRHYMLPEAMEHPSVRTVDDVPSREEFEEICELAGRLAAEFNAETGVNDGDAQEDARPGHAGGCDVREDSRDGHARDGDGQEDEPVSEDYRVEVRKALAALNKKLGRNVAKDIIQQAAGCTRLTEVPLDKLKTVMALANGKEAA